MHEKNHSLQQQRGNAGLTVHREPITEVKLQERNPNLMIKCKYFIQPFYKY